MNAHAKALPAKRVGSIEPDRRRTEAEELLRFLDEELAHFEGLVARLREKRQTLAATLDALDAPSIAAAARKAPHGAVIATILRELRESKTGLDVHSIARHVSRSLPAVNPRSVRQALTRLLQQGAVVTDGSTWRYNSSEQTG